MKALALTEASLRRLLRDRTAVFFLVMLPVVMIVVIGAMVRSPGGFRIGYVGGEAGQGQVLATELRTVGPTSRLPDEATARTALRRGELDAVVLIPVALDTELWRGGTVDVPVLTGGGEGTRAAAQAAVAAAVGRHAERVQAASFAAARTGRPPAELLPIATELQRTGARVTVGTENVATGSDYLPTGFAYSAPTMLTLFVFINTLAGGAALVQTRRLGIYSRALAAPVRPRDIVVGEGLAYVLIALAQSVLIVAVGALLFGVSWGSPAAAAALVVVWALVGAGSGMLSGSLFRTPEQASSIGPVIGIGAGMLGGAMWPLAIVPDTVRVIGHVTPHAWVVDAWTTVLSKAGGPADIAGQLAVLAGFAVLTMTTAAYRLGRRLRE